MMETMKNIPPELIETVQGLAAEGLPVEQIAFMTHASVGLVRDILGTGSPAVAKDGSVNTTPDDK